MLKSRLPLLPIRYEMAINLLKPNIDKMCSDETVISAVLIGSCARGNPLLYSDMDFVFILSDDVEIGLGTSARYEIELCDIEDIKLLPAIQVILRHKCSINNKKDYIIRGVIEDGVLIGGENLWK